MSAKTPSYVRNAQKNYEQKIQRKTVVLNLYKDKALIDKLGEEEIAFSELVKTLLKQHYKL